MQPFHKSLCFSIFLLLVTSMLASAAAYAQPKVTVSSTTGSAVGLITHVVKTYQLDEKNGLSMEIKLFDPAKAEEMVFFKNVDTGLFAVLSAALANLRGSKIRLYAPLLWSHVFLMVPKGVPYSRLEELKGKKVGSLARISGLYSSFATILKMKGLDFERDFKVIFGAPLALLGFFERGDIDAVLHYEPFVSRLLSEDKARIIVGLNDMWKELSGQPMLMIGLASYEDWISKNQEAAKRTAKTMADAIAYIKAKPAEVVEGARKSQGIKTDAEAELLKKRFPVIFPERWDKEIIDSAKLQVSKAVEYGLLKNMPQDELFIILK